MMIIGKRKRLSARRAIKRLHGDTRANATVEFAFVGMTLILMVMNAVDFGYYFYTRMQVENAAMMGSQAALNACTDQQLPATSNCAGVSTAISNGIQTTSLGTAVTLVSGSPSEGYYCINGSGSLQSVGTLSSKPANCSAAGESALQPGDYLLVQVSYNYSSLFPGLSAVGVLGINSITATSWVRMG